MDIFSNTEENYLKAIFTICEKEGKSASTNAIAEQMQTSAASVTDMLKRLADKDLINYEKYKGVTLALKGNKIATNLIRKHRLWEVFLVKSLHFSWDEVHDMAEQLEHIKSVELVQRLDQFLGEPKFDPHGDPIPDFDGKIAFRQQLPLANLQKGEIGKVVGVNDHSTAFLQYLDNKQLVLGTKVALLEKFEYDESVKIVLNGKREEVLSKKVSLNLFIQKSK